MPVECLISFDNNVQNVYYAGQEVSGNVDITLDTVKKYRAISITVLGYVKVRWSRKGAFREMERPFYHAYKQYLSSTSVVFGARNGPEVELAAGVYSYEFHVILPKTIPTSFDGKFGNIRYEILVEIQRYNRDDKVFKKPFTVIQPLDLNIDPSHRQKLETLDYNKFWSYCCSSGPLIVHFAVPYSGYAPGQKINYILYINNESAVDCSEAIVALKQEVKYECRIPYRENRFEKITITSKIYGHILRWTRKEYKDSLEIPSIPPTSFLSCNLISIFYNIVVIVRPPEYHRKIKLKIPVTIGTIPILEVANNDADGQRTIVNQPSTESRDRPPSYNITAPPSYEEALLLSARFVDDSETVHPLFAPKYPVYYNYTTPAASFEIEEDIPPCHDTILCEIPVKDEEANAL